MTVWYNLEGDTPVPVPPEKVEWKNRWQLRSWVGDVLVSTVFMPLNHELNNGAPILFETLVFNGPLADEGDRYCTKAEAEIGHAKWVKLATEAAASESEGKTDA
jgi:hypothetical protein